MKRNLSLLLLACILPNIAIANSILPFEYQAKLGNQTVAIVNINQAELSGLMTLHGIDSQKAQAILEYRDNNRRFNSFSELSTVVGIGGKLVEVNIHRLEL